MSELALVNDRLGNFFIATGLMQHLMADGGAVQLDEKQLRSIRGYTRNIDRRHSWHRCTSTYRTVDCRL